jgi:hypothetical protein
MVTTIYAAFGGAGFGAFGVGLWVLVKDLFKRPGPQPGERASGPSGPPRFDSEQGDEADKEEEEEEKKHAAYVTAQHNKAAASQRRMKQHKRNPKPSP